MYYEEKQIDGVWKYRLTPNGEWHELTLQAVIRRVRLLEEKVYKLELEKDVSRRHKQ